MKRDERIPIFLTGDEVGELWDRPMSPELRCAVMLALEAGLRLSEIMRLRWEHFEDPDMIFIESPDARLPEAWRLANKTTRIRLTLPEPGDDDELVLPKHGAGWWSDALLEAAKGMEKFDTLPDHPAWRCWILLRETYAVRECYGLGNRVGRNWQDLAELMGIDPPEQAAKYEACAEALRVNHACERIAEGKKK